MSPSPRKKSSRKTSAEPFSLVPFAMQRTLYENVLRAERVRHHLGLEDMIHTDYAEIGACAALQPEDLVFPAPHAIGARIARTRDLAAITSQLEHANSRPALTPAPDSGLTPLHHLLGDMVSQLATGTKLFGVCSLSDSDDRVARKSIFSFAGRTRLPILFIVPARIGTRADSTRDLRTLYAEFGIPVFTIDAHDPIAAFRVATEAAHNARVSRGASVLEAAVIQTPNASLNSEPPLRLLENYMRRKGNWDETWRQQIEDAARADLEAIEERSA
jgi:hypothetical protein